MHELEDECGVNLMESCVMVNQIVCSLTEMCVEFIYANSFCTFMNTQLDKQSANLKSC